MPHPKESFGKPAALRAFICADASLDIEAMLDYYGSRRRIETFFRRRKAALDSESVKSAQSKG
ncbi:MAG: hypothetical protein LBU32_15685 [Clostridiales bacterium]|nr:hypothetical protein [Clostridiales bacterium]